MNLIPRHRYPQIFIIIAAVSIMGLVFWNTTLFFQRLKDDERSKMEIWAQSSKAFNSEAKNDYIDLYLLINSSNTTIPIIYTDEEGSIILQANIPESIEQDEDLLADFLAKMRAENMPIELNLGKGKKQFIYYGNSPVLNKLRYYPIAIVLIIFLLGGVVYFFFTATKISEQNKLWVGMAKETAHQIGTPLSSLVGWVEILKTENVNPEYIEEIDKDVFRLKVITERFSKIGSIPQLIPTDVVRETQDAYRYLQARSSKLIEFSIDLPDEPLYVLLNSQLYGWTIENIVKNAIDAMRGKGQLAIEMKQNARDIHILIKDSGKGIPKAKFERIFEPGFTTKSRGWGLGLSLARRIIEEYHDGKIRVLRSELGKGTTFLISLRKVSIHSSEKAENPKILKPAT